MKRLRTLAVVVSLGLGWAACDRHDVQAPRAAVVPSADTLVAAGLKTASADRKVVLIEFGASWCTWCRKFDAWVHSADVGQIVTNNYVVVNLVVQESDDKKALENPGGLDAMKNWGGEKSGLPFYVFLDGSGKKIADSNVMPDGTNLGFPGNAQELQIFMTLIDKTAPRVSSADRARIVDYLNKTFKS